MGSKKGKKRGTGHQKGMVDVEVTARGHYHQGKRIPESIKNSSRH